MGRSQARISQIDDESADQRPSKAKTAKNKEARMDAKCKSCAHICVVLGAVICKSCAQSAMRTVSRHVHGAQLLRPEALGVSRALQALELRNAIEGTLGKLERERERERERATEPGTGSHAKTVSLLRFRLGCEVPCAHLRVA